jgi:protein O-mannosyl-transferase
MRWTESNRSELVVALGLAVGGAVLFWPVTGFEFLNFDDPDYVTRNSMVQAGITAKGTLWALLTGHASNWHPLTWLSHMLDCRLYGLNPGGHHLTSLMFHLANTLPLFGLLRQMTGALWRSALVAALFAWHPLHIESVAWVAERKDVLSTFFGLLALMSYARYAAQPRVCWYAVTLTAFALGLLAKPMLVTLPFLLLLLDYWPLRRGPFAGEQLNWNDPATRRGLMRLLGEKVPFFILALASSAITFYAQQSGGAVASMTHIPFGLRVANAVVAYAAYLWKTVWPVELAVFYPHPLAWPAWQVALAVLVLAALSAGVWLARRRYLTIGWLWYLGTLVPVIGLVQVGDQALADRYTYVPLIGLFIAASWGLHELIQRRPRWRAAGIVAAAGVLLLLAWGTRWQLSHWRNSETLFTRALAITKNNYVAHNNLGNVLDFSGRHELARMHYLETLRIRPDFAGTHYNLANVLFREGKLDAALTHYSAAVKQRPNYADAHFNLGVVLTTLGRLGEAIAHEREAIRHRPDFAEAHHQLGLLLFRQGVVAGALESYRTALRLRPRYVEAMVNLGFALEQQGRIDEAALQYRTAIEIKPDLAHAHSNLAVLLARQGQPALALPHFRAVAGLEPQSADAHYNVANALAELGQLPEAAAHYTEALRLNPDDERARRKLARIQERLLPVNP